jgi:hypothetical protein
MVVAIYVYLAVAFLVAIMAMRRGRIGWRWFTAAVLLSPLVAVVVLALLPRVRPVHPGLVRRGPKWPLNTIPMPADAGIRIIRHADLRRTPCDILINGAIVGTVDPDSVIELRVPSGHLRVEARMDWAESRPLMVRTAPGNRVDLEISHRSGSLVTFWAKIFPTDTYLSLRRVPAPTTAAHQAA